MIIYGINPILESLRSNFLPETIYIAAKKKNPKILQIESQAEKKQVKVQKLEDISRICNTKEHQGICAKIPGFRTRPLHECELESKKIVMMDGIQDPHNFGAALRVSEVFGVKDVIFHNGNSSGVTPAAVKTSAGAAFHLNIFECNLNFAIKRLKKENFIIWAMDGNAETVLSSVKLPPKLCLVIGSEAKGVRFAIRRLSDQIVRIPRFGKIDSLNVSCALSAALYELSKARGS